MATAKKLPSGSWRVQAYSDGETKSFTGATKREVEAAALQWQMEKSRIKSGNITLGEAVDLYIDRRRQSLSPITIKTYEGYKKRYLVELQNKKVSDVSKNDLQGAFDELASKLSAKTLKSIYGLFSGVLREHTGITYKIILPKLYKRIYNTPDIETAKKVLDAAKGTSLEVPITLALKCGLRVSEVCGLKWTNVSKDFIIINNAIITFGTDHVEKKPKSSAGNRKIPINNDIYKLLQSAPHTTDYVVNKTSAAIGIAFRRFLQRNNLPPMRFHDLRHAFASVMALQGVPEAYAMAIGGWETPETLHSIYEQTFDSRKEKMISKIQSAFD